MAYTWTGSSALGFDLARAPGGRAAAEVLLMALAADARYAEELARHPVAPTHVRARATALAEAAQAVGYLGVVDLTDGAPGRTDPARDLSRIARRVRAVAFGGPLDVLDLLRGDGLEHLAARTPAAVRAVAARHLGDGLLAALVAGSGPDVEVLAAAHRSVAPPPGPDLGPYAGDVRDLLAGVRTGGRDQDPYGLLVDPSSPPGDWSHAMHVASWAVELSGRTRCAAAAHLAAVVALADAGFTAEDAAAGAWNALSGAVTARLVADLLPAPESAVLARER